MLKIGLTYTGDPEKHENYVRWLKDNEDVQIVKLSAEDRNSAEVKNCDAVVLSGGIDIHPKYYYSEILDYPNRPKEFNEARDEFEVSVFNLAYKDIPVLGICRGFQLINVIRKGTLIQDLGDKNLNKTHKGNPDKLHHVNIKQQTMLFDITNEKGSDINSAHHQAIDKVGEGLVINSLADDGTIEGIEWLDKTGKPFLLGIQWHPERMFKFHLQNSPLSKKIKERFIDEIRKR